MKENPVNLKGDYLNKSSVNLFNAEVLESGWQKHRKNGPDFRMLEKLGEKYSYLQYSTWHDMHDTLRDDLLNLMIKEN